MINHRDPKYYSIGGDSFRIPVIDLSALAKFLEEAIPGAILTKSNNHKVIYKLPSGILINYWVKTGTIMIQGHSQMKNLGYVLRNIFCSQYAPDLVIDTKNAKVKQILTQRYLTPRKTA